MFYIETVSTTKCSQCGKELFGRATWALHKRQHMLERLVSTPEGRRIYGELTQCGFSDLPDARLKKEANAEYLNRIVK